MTYVIIGGVVIYIVGSYVVMAKWLTDSPGPAGLGWLAWPAAPLIMPVVGWELFKGFMRKVFS